MTAEEFLKNNIRKDCLWEDMDNLTNCPIEDVVKIMIEFAQYHVKQCLLEASENAEAEITWDGKLRVEKATILECYPDDRIK